MAEPIGITATILSLLGDGLRWARERLQRKKAEDQAAGAEVLAQADADLAKIKELAQRAAPKPPMP